jgi:hypothetical protein
VATHAASSRPWRRRITALYAVPETDGPHGRLGVAWFGATVVAVFAGVVFLALWLALAAALAAVQSARSWRGHDDAPNPAGAGVAVLLLVVGAAFGLPGLVAGAAAAGVIGVATAGKRPARLRRFVLVTAPPLLAAGSVVLTYRSRGATVALVVLVLAAAHDAGAYLVGTGANSPWEGVAAGLAADAAVTLGAAAMFKPPFPWVLGAVALVATPAGPWVTSVLLGDRETRVPAVRRLDSLVLLGPAALAVAELFLR